MTCPECRAQLLEKQGLEALVKTCTKCNKQFVQCFDKLVPIEEFREQQKEFNG